MKLFQLQVYLHSSVVCMGMLGISCLSMCDWFLFALVVFDELCLCQADLFFDGLLVVVTTAIISQQV